MSAKILTQDPTPAHDLDPEPILRSKRAKILKTAWIFPVFLLAFLRTFICLGVRSRKIFLKDGNVKNMPAGGGAF